MDRTKHKTLKRILKSVAVVSAIASVTACDEAVDSIRTGHPVRAAFLTVAGATSGSVALGVGGFLLLRRRTKETNHRIRQALRPGK